MITLVQIAFAPARKSYWIGLLFTHKKGDFGAISVTDRSCATPIWKEKRHISDTRSCATLWCSVNSYSDGIQCRLPITRTFKGPVIGRSSYPELEANTRK